MKGGEEGPCRGVLEVHDRRAALGAGRCGEQEESSGLEEELVERPPGRWTVGLGDRPQHLAQDGVLAGGALIRGRPGGGSGVRRSPAALQELRHVGALARLELLGRGARIEPAPGRLGLEEHPGGLGQREGRAGEAPDHLAVRAQDLDEARAILGEPVDRDALAREHPRQHPLVRSVGRAEDEGLARAPGARPTDGPDQLEKPEKAVGIVCPAGETAVGYEPHDLVLAFDGGGGALE